MGNCLQVDMVDILPFVLPSWRVAANDQVVRYVDHLGNGYYYFISEIKDM